VQKEFFRGKAQNRLPFVHHSAELIVQPILVRRAAGDRHVQFFPQIYDGAVGQYCRGNRGDFAQGQEFSPVESQFLKDMIHNADDRQIHRTIIERVARKPCTCAGAAKLAGGFVYRHPKAVAGEQIRGGQSCDAAANDHDRVMAETVLHDESRVPVLPRVSLLCGSFSHRARRIRNGGIERFSERHITWVPGQSCPHLARHVGIADTNRWIGKAKRTAGSG